MPSPPPIRSATTALAALLVSIAFLKALPHAENDLFPACAAHLASLFSGIATSRTDAGWLLPFEGQPVLVTSACAATDFFLMSTAVLGWHFSRRFRSPAFIPVSILGALAVAAALTVFVNALRLIAVAHAHRWVIPRLPAAYEPFLHMLTGMAVFLPALIALNLLCELHARSHAPATARA